MGMRDYTQEMAVRWFGIAEEDYGPEHDLALATINDQWLRRFGLPITGSPGQSGLSAWQRKWGRKWHPIPPDIRQLIRETAGQGRFECLPVPSVIECWQGRVEEMIPAIYCLDMRWAYQACAFQVQSGFDWRHEERPAGGWSSGLPVGFLGWVPGRYRVRWTAPKLWGHVGILPSRTADGWEWPIEGEGWADATEVRLAIERNWSVEILERVYPQGNRGLAGYDNPLRGWVEAIERMQADRPSRDDRTDLYLKGLRRVVIQTIGLFASRPREQVRRVEDRSAVAAHAMAQESFHELPDGTVEYWDYSDGSQIPLHPELSAAIWGDCRRRLLSQRQIINGVKVQTGALHLPREQVVGFALDCIYTTADPGWPYEDRPSRYRVKWHLPGPLPAPKTMTDLYAYAKRAGQ
jgi:hypothetical protein